MIWFLVAVAALIGGIWLLFRIPIPPCGECGRQIGSNDECEACVDFRTYP